MAKMQRFPFDLGHNIALILKRNTLESISSNIKFTFKFHYLYNWVVTVKTSCLFCISFIVQNLFFTDFYFCVFKNEDNIICMFSSDSHRLFLHFICAVPCSITGAHLALFGLRLCLNGLAPEVMFYMKESY